VHIPIHLNWKTDSKPLGWSFGDCKHCEQKGAARLEAMRATLYINGLIRVKEESGTIAVCALCERRVDVVPNIRPIAYTEWSPRDGLSALLGKLGMRPSVPAMIPATDTQLHSLLTSADEAARRTRACKLGSTLGILPGIAMGSLAAWVLFECGVLKAPPLVGGWMVIMGFAGFFVGSIIGGLIESRIRKDRVACTKITAAHADFHLDLFRLNELAHMHSRRIQRAVHTVSHKAISEIS
jgi:hypothetical protein